MTDHAYSACYLLDPWAEGDTDGYLANMRGLPRDSDRLMAEIDEKQGDARRIVEDIRDEFTSLVEHLEGALRIARDAIDLAIAAGAGHDRVTLLTQLRNGYEPRDDD